MTKINLTFDIGKFADTSRYTRRGSVFYHKGERTGVAAILQEVGGRPNDLITPPPSIASALSALGIANPMLLGVQLLNLGVTVAGFMILSRKLEVLDRKIDEIGGEIIALRRDVEGLDSKFEAHLFGQLRGALQASDLACRFGSPDARIASFGQLATSWETFRQIAGRMVVSGRCYDDLRLFAAYVEGAIAALLATAQIQGHFDLAASGERFGEGERFVRRLREHIVIVDRSSTALRKVHEVRAVALDLKEIADRMHAYEVECHMMREAQLLPPQGSALAAPSPEIRLAALIPVIGDCP